LTGMGNNIIEKGLEDFLSGTKKREILF